MLPCVVLPWGQYTSGAQRLHSKLSFASSQVKHLKAPGNGVPETKSNQAIKNCEHHWLSTFCHIINFRQCVWASLHRWQTISLFWVHSNTAHSFVWVTDTHRKKWDNNNSGSAPSFQLWSTFLYGSLCNICSTRLTTCVQHVEIQLLSITAPSCEMCGYGVCMVSLVIWLKWT